MSDTPFDPARLIALVKSIPKGQVTTYGRLAEALGGIRNDRHQIGEMLHPQCRETVMVLARGGSAHEALLPCWRIVDDNGDGILSPLSGPNDTISPNDPFYQIVIQPLIDEGISLTAPGYVIDPRYLYDLTDGMR